jgi:hypothetical protein
MATPTKGNTTNANPTPGANFKTQNHTQNTGSNGLIIAQFTMWLHLWRCCNDTTISN